MQNYIKGNHLYEKNVNGSDLHSRRLSKSGFEYPKDFYTTHCPLNFPSIPEAVYQNMIPLSNCHMSNGDHNKIPEIANQNFFSESDVNLVDRNHVHGSLHMSTLDPRYHYNDSNFIPRFSSTPLIAQSSTKHQHNQNHVIMEAQSNHAPPTMSNNTYHAPVSSYSQIFYNDNPLAHMQSQYVLYDLATNSYQNVVFYSPAISDRNDSYSDHRSQWQEINDYVTSTIDLPSQEPLDLTDNYLKCQLDLAQDVKDMDIFPSFVKDDLIYFLPPELPIDNVENNRTESQSMPSLHGDGSTETDFDTSEDDQLNTVHGEEMLKELQKLSSVFTNVVNLPLSHNKTVIGSTEFPRHCNNLSRFKKTRIEERTMFWHNQRFIVKDNMVKIIPDQVLNIQPMNIERLDQFETNILGWQISKPTETEEVVSYPADCVHSTYRCRPSKHSSRANQKYRSSANTLSPTDVYSSANQQMSSNISSRHLHRKSLQIPLRIPIVWNPVIPVLSPSVQQRNRKFFEPTNISNNKGSRQKRRWSVGGMKLESSHCLRSQNSRLSGEPINPVKNDGVQDFLDNRYFFDLQGLEECSNDYNPQICSNFELKLDKQLGALKKTVISYVETNLSEIKDEIKLLKSSHINLENQLQFYREKVQIFEQSVRQNLPQDEWGRYGIVDDDISYQR